MREIILWYNKNSKFIWKTIIIIIITIVVIQVVKRLWMQNQIKNNIYSDINIGENFNSITLTENKSTVSGQNLSKSQTNSLTILDKFVEYCNNANINQAYDLLSEDCKNQMYQSVDKFKENYYNKIFTGKKNISVENWSGNIFKVKFMEDALSTGKYNEESIIQDYITIIEDENNNTKLNINSYIGRQEINTEKDDKNIKIKVLEKHQYMDSETYVFEITNNLFTTVLLDDLKNPDTIYLEDSNNIKYYAYTHEISEPELKLSSKETKRITIKYYNRYISNKEIEKIVFSRIILNHNAYINYQNVTYYNDYGTFQVNL